MLLATYPCVSYLYIQETTEPPIEMTSPTYDSVVAESQDPEQVR